MLEFIHKNWNGFTNKTLFLFQKQKSFFSGFKAQLSRQLQVKCKFLFNSSAGSIHKKFGGARHSPVSYKTISDHLRKLRHAVAAENIEKLRTVFLTGPQEWDETWLRCRRKHNRGRYTERKFSMVSVCFFSYNGSDTIIFWCVWGSGNGWTNF